MIQWVELVVFTVLFGVVSVMGFLASRWRRAETLEHLDEWGLGGRKFGAWITWFLIGGDIYTAYTFVAVPALLFGAGAMGFFALPYTRDPLSAGVPAGAAAVVGLAGARLRHPGRLRARPLRQPAARVARGDHRARRHHALHRAAAGRPRGRAAHDGAERHRARRAPAAVHRVRDPRGLHLPVGAAGAGADRVRQGHPDLHRDPRRRDLAAGPARRLVGDLRGGVGQARPAQPGHRTAAGLDPAHGEQPAAVRHPRPGLGAGAVPLPALAHGHPGLPRAAT